MSTTPEPAAAKRRVKKRLLIPAILLGLILLVLVGLWIRGTWADTTVKNPSNSAEGTITQLYRPPDGAVQVRCAAVIDSSSEKVWAVVSDYANHVNFLPYVSEIQVAEDNDGIRVSGTAHSRLWGDFPFSAYVRHKENPVKGEYQSSWDESADGTINRGSWTVTPTLDGKTLLVYALQVEVDPYPNFIVRNILMDRLHLVVKAVRDEVKRRGQ